MPGDEDQEQDTFDIRPGTGGEARQHDEDGDGTQVGWWLTETTISGLEDQLFDQDRLPPSDPIDLWDYAEDPETPDSGLTFTIEGSPPSGAGVEIVNNRWLIIDPSFDWCGYTDVIVRVTNPGGVWDEDTFRVAVTWSCKG